MGAADNSTAQPAALHPLEQTVKELSDLKYALDEAAIVATTDQRGIITYVNDKFCTISKYSREELLGQDHRLINSQYHSKEFIRSIWTTIANGKTWHGELRNRAKDGSIYWVDTTIVPFLDDQGKPFQYIAIRFDVTERKLAEERIRQQASLLDNAQDAILVCDLKYHILYWNKGAERMYGWPLPDVLGKNIYDVLFAGDQRPLEETHAALQDTGEWKTEARDKTKDGRKLIVESRWTLIGNDQGQPDYILIINTDVTEQKLIEEHLLRAQRMESIGTLAGGIAHDLNNILSPIIMSVEMLSLKETDPETKRWLSLIGENAERGADLIKQVLTFARGLEGKRIPVQIKHIVKDLISVLQETLPKSITLKYDVATSPWLVAADPTQIHQVLMNVCLNARDAMPNGGSLRVAVANVHLDENDARINPEAEPGGYVQITVEDTGTGMSKETVKRIFDPFFTSKALGHGTGLGLSTALTIVQSHGGFINVYSELGRGSRFSINLPAMEDQVEVISPDPVAAYPYGNGELILVVDDEENIVQITTATLERFGYRAVSAADGAEGLKVYEAGRGEIALVVTDMSMPDMDGPSMIKELRKIDPVIRIIGMSGLTNAERTAELQSQDVSTFLTKPFTAEKLLTSISETLRKS
jgi:two-component system, cell cycle sensor histidine kinase and response regulator CckA